MFPGFIPLLEIHEMWKLSYCRIGFVKQRKEAVKFSQGFLNFTFFCFYACCRFLAWLALLAVILQTFWPNRRPKPYCLREEVAEERTTYRITAGLHEWLNKARVGYTAPPMPTEWSLSLSASHPDVSWTLNCRAFKLRKRRTANLSSTSCEICPSLKQPFWAEDTCSGSSEPLSSFSHPAEGPEGTDAFCDLSQLPRKQFHLWDPSQAGTFQLN